MVSPSKDAALATPPNNNNNNSTPDAKNQDDHHVPASPMMRDIEQKGRDLLDSWQQLQHETESALESATQKLYASQNNNNNNIPTMYHMDSSIETGEDDMLLFNKQSGEYPLEDESPAKSIVHGGEDVAAVQVGSSSDAESMGNDDEEVEDAIAAAPSSDVIPPPRTLTPQSHEDTHALVILAATSSESDQMNTNQEQEHPAAVGNAPYPLNVTESIVTKDAVLESVPATTVVPSTNALPEQTPDDGFGSLELFDPQTTTTVESFPPFIDDSIAPIPVIEYNQPPGSFPSFEFDEQASRDFLEEKKTDDSSPLWMGTRPAEDDADEQPLMSKENSDARRVRSARSDDGYSKEKGVVILHPTSPPRASPRASSAGASPRSKKSASENMKYMPPPPPDQKAACCVIL